MEIPRSGKTREETADATHRPQSCFRALIWALALVTCLAVFPAVAAAQAPDEDRDRARQSDTEADDDDQLDERDRPRRPPNPDLPPRRTPKRLNMRPQVEHDEDGYRLYPPDFDEERREALNRAYRQGFDEGSRSERFEAQLDRLGETYRGAMSTGHIAFAEGDYPLAARQFLLAATIDQGDPVARLCAAHAHFALGDYVPAARLVLRAMELEPRTLYLSLDIRGAYGQREDFARHLHALETAADDHAADGDFWLLLGYCRYFSGNTAGSVEPLEKAARLMPEDRVVGRMANLARSLSGPRNSQRPSDRR